MTDISWREEVDATEWDQALAALGGHPLQSDLWGEARRNADGRISCHLMAMRSDQPLWMMRYEIHSASFLGLVAWAPRGPTTTMPLNEDGTLLATAAARLKQRGITLLVTDRWRRLEEAQLPRQLSSRPGTFWIDLSQGHQAVWRNLNRNWRYNVGKARRAGVTVTATRCGEGVETFFRRCVETGRRKQFEFTGSIGLMRALLKFGTMGPVEARLFVARHQEHDAAGVFILKCGRSAHYIWGSTDLTYTDRRVSEAAHWAAIEWALDAGCTLYDLEGSDAKRNPGTYAFKKKMGGQEVILVGKQYIPLTTRGRLAAFAAAHFRG